MNDSDRPGRNSGPELLTIQREQLRADGYTHFERGWPGCMTSHAEGPKEDGFDFGTHGRRVSHERWRRGPSRVATTVSIRAPPQMKAGTPMIVPLHQIHFPYPFQFVAELPVQPLVKASSASGPPTLTSRFSLPRSRHLLLA
jgi:hypothetical protein